MKIMNFVTLINTVISTSMLGGITSPLLAVENPIDNYQTGLMI